MIKHIVILHAKSYGGSWGVGDTEGEALKKAKSNLGGGKIKEQRHRTVEVPEGRKLVVRSLVNGIEWWTEPETTEKAE